MNTTMAQPRSCEPSLEEEAFVVREAEQDAQNVAIFLRRLDPQQQCNGPPTYWPASFLIGLGAALRLLTWDLAGLTLHLESGLPHGEQAVRMVIMWCTSWKPEDRDRAVLDMVCRTIDLARKRLVWESQTLIGSPIQMNAVCDAAFEDILLTAVARYLLQNNSKGTQ